MKNGGNSQGNRIPTWGILLMLIASIIGIIMLGQELGRRYKAHWPW